jgi:hypothetical protein
VSTLPLQLKEHHTFPDGTCRQTLHAFLALGAIERLELLELPLLLGEGVPFSPPGTPQLMGRVALDAGLGASDWPWPGKQIFSEQERVACQARGSQLVEQPLLTTASI